MITHIFKKATIFFANWDVDYFRENNYTENMENYEHYISRNIKAFYKRSLFSPIVFLLLMGILWVAFPIQDMIWPRSLTDYEILGDEYQAGDCYVSAEFTDLTFCGYTKELFGRTSGYYYYGMRGGQCYILLLSPQTCEEGNPSIDSITTTVRILQENDTYRELLSAMAEKLEWTAEGMMEQMPKYYYSEPDYHKTGTMILAVMYFGTILYALLQILLDILSICFPFLSRPVMDLAIFGNPKAILKEAEEELATLPQLATDDMFITEHYFILTSPYGNAIVPIQEILWIYKYSTLHKVLWYHFSISYTLHITANKHFYIRCPKNLKSDIDGIIDYLSEANHDILVGFSEENRVETQKKLGKPFHIEKLIALLYRKI